MRGPIAIEPLDRGANQKRRIPERFRNEPSFISGRERAHFVANRIASQRQFQALHVNTRFFRVSESHAPRLDRAIEFLEKSALAPQALELWHLGANSRLGEKESQRLLTRERAQHSFRSDARDLKTNVLKRRNRF